jgi:YD repeat-containing protein
VLNAYRWSYDALGRPVSESSSDGVSTWQYDASSQVTAADHTRQASERYTYDPTGNRTAATQSSGTANTITTGTNNRLLADDRYRYEYDAEGNRTRRTDLDLLTKHSQALTAAFEDCLIKSGDDSRAISKALNNTRKVMNDAESLAKKLASFYQDIQWKKLMTAAQLLILAQALASSGQAMAKPTPEQQQYRDHFLCQIRVDFELCLRQPLPDRRAHWPFTGRNASLYTIDRWF